MRNFWTRSRELWADKNFVTAVSITRTVGDQLTRYAPIISPGSLSIRSGYHQIWISTDLEAGIPAFGTSEPFTEVVLTGLLVAVESANGSCFFPAISGETSVDDWLAVPLHEMPGFLFRSSRRAVSAGSLGRKRLLVARCQCGAKVYVVRPFTV